MSTIKVDTYLTRGGASEIAIDKLKGASSASSISVVAEGGSTTTNLQQGLCKVWHNFNGTGTVATNDSFNVASLTDNKEGDYTTAFTNNMGNANYLHLHHVIEASVYTQYLASDYSKTTSQLRMEQDSWNGNSSGGASNDDFTHCNEGMIGDLA